MCAASHCRCSAEAGVACLHCRSTRPEGQKRCQTGEHASMHMLQRACHASRRVRGPTVRYRPGSERHRTAGKINGSPGRHTGSGQRYSACDLYVCFSRSPGTYTMPFSLSCSAFVMRSISSSSPCTTTSRVLSSSDAIILMLNSSFLHLHRRGICSPSLAGNKTAQQDTVHKFSFQFKPMQSETAFRGGSHKMTRQWVHHVNDTFCCKPATMGRLRRQNRPEHTCQHSGSSTTGPRA